jgi:hypothetical protein
MSSVCLEQTGRLSRAVIWGLSPVSFAKIFLFAAYPNHFHIHRHPTPLEGRIAIVTDAGRDAMDAGGALTRACAGGRRSRVVLTPRRWRQVSRMAMSALTGLTRRYPLDDGDNKARSPTIRFTHFGAVELFRI